MADEKEFKNLVTAAGIKHTKDSYQKICGSLGIAFTSKELKDGLKNLIIASNVANPTRDFADVLKKMSATAPVVVHVDTAPNASSEEKKSPEPIVYPLCDASLLNREALSEQIHAIHNFLRNRGVGYGMSALKVFNLFYGLARIEQYDLFSMIGLDASCKFSELVNMARRVISMDESLPSGAIYELTDQYQEKINAIQMTRKFMMSELPDNISNETIARLVIDIDRLIQSEIQIGEQICGKIYEYFIGRDQTAISEMGAYFTNRSITQFIYEQLAPELDAEGKVQSMIDPFGGSGGFTTGYVMDLKKRFESIDWKDGISCVYHFDMNNDVVKYAALELMCLTRALPNMCDNMICANSFATERFAQYKYVCTNPPYGGDNIGESASQKTRELLKKKLTAEITSLKVGGTINADLLKKRELQLTKVNKEIQADDDENDKQKVKTGSSSTSQFIKNYARKNGLFASESRVGQEVLFGNDKEATSLILIAALVAPGGTGIGVLKEGVFFSGKYALLRKHLIEKFNVRKVISVPKDQFENTTTKTSIIIFDNDPVKKTSYVEFSELKASTYEQNEFGEDPSGNLAVIGMKGAFREVVEHSVSSANLTELQKIIITEINGKQKQTQPWSLDGTHYSMRETLPGPGYKMIKLGNLCTFLPKSQRAASFGKNEGKYPFYSSSANVKRCDVVDYESEAVIVGSGGTANVAIANNFSCSADNHVLSGCIVPNKYVYYILHGSMNLLQAGFHGSVLKHISKSYISDLKIPVLEDSTKMNEWVAKISAVYDERRAAEAKICDLESKIAVIILDSDSADKSTEYIIGDIISYVTGPYRTIPKVDVGGQYPLYSSSLRVQHYVETYDHAEWTVIMNAINCDGNCAIHVANKFCTTSNTIAFTTSIVDVRYLHALLSIKYKSAIENLYTGSAQKKLSKSDFNKLKIQLSKQDTIASIVNIYDQLHSQRTEYARADIAFKKLIAELAREAILPDPPIASEPVGDVPSA